MDDAFVCQQFSLDAEVMNLALETYQNEGKQLNNPTQTLKSEGFYRKHTVSGCLWQSFGSCKC